MRIPSGAKEAAGKNDSMGKGREKHASGAEAHVESAASLQGMNPLPTG
jgi:hypothetical protein